MTLEQMAAIAAPPKPKPQTGLILVIPSGISAGDMLFQEESKALEVGVCPRCSTKVDSEILVDGRIRFTCQKWPVFHMFTRSSSFMKFD